MLCCRMITYIDFACVAAWLSASWSFQLGLLSGRWSQDRETCYDTQSDIGVCWTYVCYTVGTLQGEVAFLAQSTSSNCLPCVREIPTICFTGSVPYFFWMLIAWLAWCHHHLASGLLYFCISAYPCPLISWDWLKSFPYHVICTLYRRVMILVCPGLSFMVCLYNHPRIFVSFLSDCKFSFESSLL